VQRGLSRRAAGDSPGHAVSGRVVVYYTIDVRTLNHGKIMAFLPGFRGVRPQMLLQETELHIKRSGYVVLAVITKSDIEAYDGLDSLEISVGVAMYRVSQSGKADKRVTQTTDNTAAGGNERIFAYDQTPVDDKSYSSSCSIDFVGRDENSCDLESAERVVVVSTPDTWTFHSLDASGELSSKTDNTKWNCLALAPGFAILMARQPQGDVPPDLIMAYLQGNLGNTAAVVDKEELVPGDWRRERVVVDVPSDAQKTRLHLRFERTKKDNPAPPSVGLDDIQLLPVLSSEPLCMETSRSPSSRART
jgi:hypothetical protein